MALELPRKLHREPIAASTQAAFRAYPWTDRYLISSTLIPIRPPHTATPSSAFMRSTLASKTSPAIAASQSFYLPVPPKPLPSLTPYTPTPERPDTFGQIWTLYLLGAGAEGGTPGVAHGGCIAALLDEQASSLMRAWAAAGVEGMVYCNVRYHGSIRVPGVVLCKAAKARVEGHGRKVWVEVAIEDGEGRVVVRGEVLFVNDERGGAKL